MTPMLFSPDVVLPVGLGTSFQMVVAIIDLVQVCTAGSRPKADEVGLSAAAIPA